jgi:signal transduction histidine kinase/ActR/RegA family two-component response regulator
MGRLLAWLDRYSRVAEFADERGRMRARFVIAGAGLGALASLAASVALAFVGAPIQVVQSALGLLLCLVVLVLWRFTLSLTLMAHLTGVVLSTSYLLGGFDEGTLSTAHLYALIPLIALFLCGWRVGTLWLGLVLVQLLVLAVALRPDEVAARASFDSHFVRVLVQALTVFLVGVLYELGQSRALAAMAIARAAAEDASREKSRFLAKVSHEIRTPLNGVLGTTEIAMLDELPPRTREHLATIHQSGGTLLALINDLLDLARAEAGRFELHATPFVPARLAHEVVALHAARAQAKALELTARVSTRDDLRLLGDATRLSQVLGNLVSNALKFTEHGGVTVECSADEEGDAVRLRYVVRDSGPGISLVDQARLFQPFTQLSQHEGSGLGLAVSHALVEAMGGLLRVESVPGQGSSFIVELRLQTTARAPQHTPVASTWRFAGRVLVVDDNEVNRRVAAGLLEKLGVEVSTAADGQAALDALSAHRFQLVLMDVQMPGLDGLAATRALRQRGDTTPIIALTANAHREDLQACLDAGMGDCLTKPLRLSRLVEALLRVMPEGGATPVLKP